MFKNIKIYNQNLITKAEKKTFESIDSFDVMQRAADACSKYIFFNYRPKRVLVLCGPGNNGGDGILIAKNLLKQKCHVSIFAPLGYGKSKDSIKALDKLNNKNVFEENFEYRDFDFFIDALFGFNFNKKLSKDLKKIFKDINSQKFTKISIDIPSGVYCDNGQIDEIAIQADITLTFHRLKPAHVLLPGKEFSKKIEILEIGLTNIDSDTNVSIIDKPIINPPAINEHKYNHINFQGKSIFSGDKVTVHKEVDYNGSVITDNADIISNSSVTGLLNGTAGADNITTTAIIQPSGSINDIKVINYADKYHLPLYFSKYRFFRH